MGKLHEIRLKYDQFMDQIDVNIAMSIQSNEKELVDMNKRQMLDSKTSENKALIHARTGSEYLSPAYAKREGKRKPNLFKSGKFQSEMFLSVDENAKTFFIDSFSDISKYLVEAYGKIFGIADNAKAKQINLRSFSNLLKSKVFGR